MAKAAKPSSTPVWIWLRDALELAVAAFGTDELAKERLLKWLTTKRLPWICHEWRGLDAEGLAKRKLWGTDPKIDWEDNRAREVITIDTEYGKTWRYGADALGIKVLRTHLLALLPEAPNEHEKISDPPPTKAASGARKKRLGPQVRRALPVLKELYPPDGWAPDHVGTEFVRGQVNGKLADDSKQQGLGEVSWETINRLLGRDPNYPAARLREL